MWVRLPSAPGAPCIQINVHAIYPNSLLQPRLPNTCRLRGRRVGGMATHSCLLGGPKHGV